MKIYQILRSLEPEILRAGWISFVKKGDRFRFKEAVWEVSVNTKKTLRLKNINTGNSITLKKFGRSIYDTGKHEGQFFRDVEGILSNDLLQERNKFHKNSDFFGIYRKHLTSPEKPFRV